MSKLKLKKETLVCLDLASLKGIDTGQKRTGTPCASSLALCTEISKFTVELSKAACPTDPCNT